MTTKFIYTLTGVGLVTLVYKSLAALQQLLIARKLGATDHADAFFLAQVVPVLLSGLIYSAAAAGLMSSFRDRAVASPQHALRLGWWMFGLLGLLAAVFVMFGQPFLQWMGATQESGLLGEATLIQQILLPLLPIQGMAGVLAGFHILKGRVLFSPLSLVLFYSAGAFGLAFTENGSAVMFACSMVAGAMLQLVALSWPLVILSRENSAGEGCTRSGFLRNALPALGCNAISTLFLVSDRHFAAALGPGQVAVISYVYSMATLPTQIFANSVIGASQPGWLEQETFANSLIRAVRLVAILLIPVAASMAVGPVLITQIVLGKSSFAPDQTLAIASLTAAFAPAAVGFALKDTISAAAIAQGAATPAFLAGLFGLGSAQLLKACLPEEMGLHASALATCCGLAITVGLLHASLRIRRQDRPRLSAPVLDWKLGLTAGVAACSVFPFLRWGTQSPASQACGIGFVLSVYSLAWLILRPSTGSSGLSQSQSGGSL